MIATFDPQSSILDPRREACLISDPHRIDDILDSADDRQRRQFPGLGILGWHVLDMHVELAELAFDIDVVAIAW